MTCPAMSTHNQPPAPDETPADHREVTFFTIAKSVFSSFIGVQNGKFWHFFFAGLLFVALFLGMVWLMVNYLIATTP